MPASKKAIKLFGVILKRLRNITERLSLAKRWVTSSINNNKCETFDNSN